MVGRPVARDGVLLSVKDGDCEEAVTVGRTVDAAGAGEGPTGWWELVKSDRLIGVVNISTAHHIWPRRQELAASAYFKPKV